MFNVISLLVSSSNSEGILLPIVGAVRVDEHVIEVGFTVACGSVKRCVSIVSFFVKSRDSHARRRLL